ncbi:MAG: hypothetical protein ACKONH_08325 [Planctomycetia bacterium]
MSTTHSPRRGVTTAQAVDLQPGAHRSYLCLATAAAAAAALLCLAGCQTARAPNTVAPPATGMIGQPAPYGVQPQPMGAAYPAAPPMPGPATQWQASAPAAPAANTWSWTQPQPAAPAYPAPPQMQAPNSQSIANQAQQYGNQMQNTANQQWQQMANQAQTQANQYTNQATQQANQYINQTGQQAQQYVNGAQQQVTAQMPAYQPQPTNTTWNPFSTSALSQPPARATPVAVPRY